VDVIVIAPEPSIVIRPRLYEANPASMCAPLGSLFEAAGIKFIRGFAERIDSVEQTVLVKSEDGKLSIVSYARLILAAGSELVRPPAITGLEHNAFDIDSIQSAAKLDAHILQLGLLPESPARDTIIVCGAGFTGLELVTELPKRIAHLPNKPRLILIDHALVLGRTLGAGPRAIIEQAIQELGIEVRLGSEIISIDPDGLTLATGERIDSKTVVWTAGVRATQLTKQIPGPKDNLSRLFVDKYLRVPSSPHIFATGDSAAALADARGHYALMSCQQANTLGRVSGYNAAADLLQESLIEYSQPEYITCLDLGDWGAVVTYGWDRKVKLTGDMAKKVKTYINQVGIYPPQDVQAALALAKPDAVADSGRLLEKIILAVA
jgi:NADH dehydrogenase FAD-containing subunit